jgi:hypothetical protein
MVGCEKAEAMNALAKIEAKSLGIFTSATVF